MSLTESMVSCSSTLSVRVLPVSSLTKICISVDFLHGSSVKSWKPASLRATLAPSRKTSARFVAAKDVMRACSTALAAASACNSASFAAASLSAHRRAAAKAVCSAFIESLFEPHSPPAMLTARDTPPAVSPAPRYERNAGQLPGPARLLERVRLRSQCRALRAMHLAQPPAQLLPQAVSQGKPTNVQGVHPGARSNRNQRNNTQ
eukprot:CAMPEP_0171070680 /NCGR_PEP_ID=MMETSP0766_2-20121228/9895_1 /TAXON_ID=439317 /ORGANISM="Gambierdiscus australes, Strain CAWD 149" /LENGTH=204 /DNA_ID=CAMNT_0011527183 /DNA_START=308 /DNA_END=923 /DNA_ORIENTATION=-